MVYITLILDIERIFFLSKRCRFKDSLLRCEHASPNNGESGGQPQNDERDAPQSETTPLRREPTCLVRISVLYLWFLSLW